MLHSACLNEGAESGGEWTCFPWPHLASAPTGEPPWFGSVPSNSWHPTAGFCEVLLKHMTRLWLGLQKQSLRKLYGFIWKEEPFFRLFKDLGVRTVISASSLQMIRWNTFMYRVCVGRDCHMEELTGREKRILRSKEKEKGQDWHYWLETALRPQKCWLGPRHVLLFPSGLWLHIQGPVP